MGKLKDSSIHFFADEKYSSIFEQFTKRESVQVHNKNIFVLAAVVGFKNSSKIENENRGKEILASFLTPSEEELFMNIVFQDEKVDNDLEKLGEIIDSKEGKEIIEEYVNGGLELMVIEAFFDNWDGHELNPDYEHYYFDLIKFISTQVKNVPF
ncbi:hypothetical protein K2V61_11920 [Staphylococcus simulans]|uniref:hypothetical protein n=1 Tax=Staphylococcus simulans TaxID=1286 RepID=UPI001E2CFA06|nr:hypothetical protein [Staphylococcus simulans]MCD8916248.1 hypothetical protein [Staphylococcus simulans]